MVLEELETALFVNLSLLVVCCDFVKLLLTELRNYNLLMCHTAVVRFIYAVKEVKSYRLL